MIEHPFPIVSARWLAPLVLGSLLVSPVGCGGDQPTPRQGLRAKARDGDPELNQIWQMPADKSVLERGELGSEPPALAEALMQRGWAPGNSHRITQACAESGALTGTATFAVRFTIADDGSLASIEGDPSGPASGCLVGGLETELKKLEGLPAGAALMVLRFHPDQPG